MVTTQTRRHDRMRTPRAAAIAGIVFSVLLTIVFVLIRVAVPDDSTATAEWWDDDARRNGVILALNLVPFAGIAFLWFIGVIRDRLGDAEDRFFATVFLGSGLLFIAMLFVGAASGSGLLLSAADDLPAGAWPYGRELTFLLLTVYAMRMAAVFAISTTSLFARLGLAPRWLIVLGYATGVVLLVTLGVVPWAELVFPAWILVLSLHMLFVTAHPTPAELIVDTVER